MSTTITNNTDRVMRFIAASAVIIFPVSILAVEDIHGAVYVVLVLLGIWVMFARRDQVLPLRQQEWWFFIAMSLLFIAAMFTNYMNGGELYKANRFLILMLGMPVYLFFKYVQIDQKYIWGGVVAGSLMAAAVAGYYKFGPANMARASGDINPLIFGNLAVLLGGLALASFGWFRQKHVLLTLIPLLGFLAAVFAGLLSQTRGAWLMIPLMLLIFIGVQYRAASKTRMLLIFAAMLGILASSYFVPQIGVQSQVDRSVTSIRDYLASEDVNDAARTTSIGIRFEMWKAAWMLFEKNRWFGAGWGSYSEDVKQLIEQGFVNERVERFDQPHNQYLSSMAKGGIVSIVALLLFFGILVYITGQWLVSSNNARQQVPLALALALLLVGFIVFGLSESMFERSKPVLLMSFYLCLLMAVANSQRAIQGGQAISPLTASESAQ